MSIKNTPDKYSSDTSFGQGELAEYVPYLNVRKVSRPNARSNRPPCWKTGRHHEFLSDGEERYFLYLLWAEDVVLSDGHVLDVVQNLLLSGIDLNFEILLPSQHKSQNQEHFDTHNNTNKPK